ncbi:MAG: NAD(+)/NADH kinase [Candidatus Zixiibacteriota bacterium]
MRLGIVPNMNRPDAENVIQRIISWGNKNGVALIFASPMANELKLNVKRVPVNELPDKSDVIISLGGDGTLLSSARAVKSTGIPILGINLGSLGFLTQLTPKTLEQTLDLVLEGKYILEKRMVAEVELENGQELESPFALNEIVVDRGPISRIINLDLYADDYFICSYAADGLIIATPTGSTAYSLAVGGPIINPLMNAFIVSPISAFSLTTRPIVFPESCSLRIVTRSKHSDPIMTLDGQVFCNLSRESSFIIRKADFCINFIVFRNNSFYDILRNKLHWGRLPEANPD